MPLKIVRNDITKMHVDAIVNTANEEPLYGSGIDTAVYRAAGEEKLLQARRKIGRLEQGEVAITEGFALLSRYIIHAVSPLYKDGESGEEDKLRSCYRKSLHLALRNGCKSIAFPLIATGSFGYPKEEGMRIAVDEIHSFLLRNDLLVYLVVFDSVASKLGANIYADLESYIDDHYVDEKRREEYSDALFSMARKMSNMPQSSAVDYDVFQFEKESALDERIRHLSDTFQQYLFYMIDNKKLTNASVYKRAIITKQTFSKIKVNPNYHPDKTTAMRLCVGAMLNMDETRDLLMRAGYALSPCDKRDIIFSYFIENEIYDMIEIDIALEEHGLPCFIE